MTIVFTSAVLNIHQIGLADELYRVTGGNFYFIETALSSFEDSKGGITDFSDRPYLLNAAKSISIRNQAMDMIQKADVMIYGASPLEFLKVRMRSGKLTFMYTERWLKRGYINLLSPRLIKQQFFYHLNCKDKPLYALCASAYAAADFKKMHSFTGKCYKWGYFISAQKFDINKKLSDKRTNKRIKILWVARFIPLKHPELLIELAKRLREKGVNFLIDMIGNGEPLKSQIKELVSKNCLSENISFPDTIPNEELRIKMRDYQIFCFTSDSKEGWGAVLSEAMAAGCCPVSSKVCGATPFLIKDGFNGFSFDIEKKDDLYKKVYWLINHPDKMYDMSFHAYETINKVWNPTIAAQNLYRLSEALIINQPIIIENGPCSPAD